MNLSIGLLNYITLEHWTFLTNTFSPGLLYFIVIFIMSEVGLSVPSWFSVTLYKVGLLSCPHPCFFYRQVFGWISPLFSDSLIEKCPYTPFFSLYWTIPFSCVLGMGGAKEKFPNAIIIFCEKSWWNIISKSSSTCKRDFSICIVMV